MIALLSNVTIDTLAAALSDASGEKVWVSQGYNTWVQELINADFEGSKPEIIFLLIDGNALLCDLIHTGSHDIQSVLDSAFSVIDTFIDTNKDIKLFVSSLDIRQSVILPSDAKRIEHKAESYWRNLLEEKSIPIIELAEVARNIGRDKFYSAKMWYLGSIPFSMAGGNALVKEMYSLFKAYRGKRAKCLVLDLDNTLWGGVIGEDGLGGIELSTSNEGARYRDFQKRIKELEDEGVLLAVVSKNNREDALCAINNHPDMVLRERDFAVIKANWEPKSVNIERLAKELNLGLDSFVFIDDNPVERETVKITLPEVHVPDFPKETSSLEGYMVSIAKEYFPTIKITEEDTYRTEQYLAESKRTEAKKSSHSLQEYLATLEMKLSCRLINDDDILRASQLTQKTNQFNLTTRRYTETDIRTMLYSDSHQVWIGELADKFGNYGKIILAIIRLDFHNKTAYVDTFLMSCRAMGRNVESDFLRRVETELASAGITKLVGEYIETQKNSVVKDFWKEQGFEPISEQIFSKTL